MKLTATLAHLLRFAALFLLVEAGTFWSCSRLFLTPVQLHYLGAYVYSSFPIFAPSVVEVRWIWKTGPRGARELASEDDAVPIDGGIGMALSTSAIEAGWTGLMEEASKQIRRDQLRAQLADLAFDGQSLWIFALLPATCGGLLFCYAVCGLEWLKDWLPELPWPRVRDPWEKPPPTLVEKLAAQAQRLRMRFARLHRRSGRRIESHPPAAATTTLAETPAKRVFSPFGVHNGTRAGGYLWSQKDEID